MGIIQAVKMTEEEVLEQALLALSGGEESQLLAPKLVQERRQPEIRNNNLLERIFGEIIGTPAFEATDFANRNKDAIIETAGRMLPVTETYYDWKDTKQSSQEMFDKLYNKDYLGATGSASETLANAIFTALPFMSIGAIKKVGDIADTAKDLENVSDLKEVEAVADLPMDEASRLARAKEMGFDTDTVYYHGTGSNIKEFDPKYVGLGNDLYGSGFYFTNNKDLADRYATHKTWESLGRDPSLIPKGTPNTIEAYLKLEKAVPKKGKMTRGQIRELIKSSPELDDHLWNFGDYEHYGKEKILNEAVDIYYTNQFTPLDTLNKISNDFYRGYEGDYLANIQNKIGWDHVLTEADGKKVVTVFKPQQIRSTKAKFDPAKKDSADLLAGLGGLGVSGLLASAYLDNENQ